MAKKVVFWATKEIKKPIEVNFKKSTGEKVSFEATKKVLKPVKVEFYTKEKKKK